MKKIAYLTFDDGPSEPFTRQILEILKKENIKATFFVCGMNVERHPEVLREIAKQGHSIGNHSYSHSRKLTRLGSWSEIARTNKVIRNVLRYEPKFYRAPYGEFAPWIVPYTLYKGMKLVRWNTLGKDWEDISPNKIAENVLSKNFDSLTILLHDGDQVRVDVDRSKTIEATIIVIKELRDRGYVFLPL